MGKRVHLGKSPGSAQRLACKGRWVNHKVLRAEQKKTEVCFEEFAHVVVGGATGVKSLGRAGGGAAKSGRS